MEGRIVWSFTRMTVYSSFIDGRDRWLCHQRTLYPICVTSSVTSMTCARQTFFYSFTDRMDSATTKTQEIPYEILFEKEFAIASA
jgi:hypothetical protein